MLRVRVLRTLLLLVTLGIFAGPASAILYNGSYTVTSNSNPATGLAVSTINDFGSFVNPTTNSFTGLNVVSSHFVDLFQIFALESPPYSGNDLVPQPISVTFNFTSPSVASGIISGTTVGLLNDEGLLHWNAPLTLFFPTGRLTISLSDASFADFFNGIVVAQFVPEPDSLVLLFAGLIGVVACRRRKAVAR